MQQKSFMNQGRLESSAVGQGWDKIGSLMSRPVAARIALLVLVVAIGALVWTGLGMTVPVQRAGPSDFDTYQRVVEALKAGQGYYPALHDALLAGGYGTLSPLNWRTPFWLSFLSWFPSLEMARAALAVLAAGAWGLGVALAYRRLGTGGAIWAGVVLALSLVTIGAPRAELSFEVCAGTLILISVSAYGLGWRWLAVIAGVAALFVRELAIVYVVVCLVDAMRRRDRLEVLGWLVALAAYGVFYQWHMQQVAALLGPEDHAAAAGWLQFGGIVFVLRTASYNGIMLVLPYWAAGVLLPVGLLGLARLPRAAITVVGYLLLFFAYGRPENEYWGGIYAPLIALGVVFAPAAIMMLGTRAFALNRRASGD
jgi:hypothetical protein